jgi:acetoacetyl-CoA synthetase
LSTPLWQPTDKQIQDSNLSAFLRDLSARYSVEFADYDALHAWSVEHAELFWQALVEHAKVIAEDWGNVVLQNGKSMPGARWFPDARLNFAQNLLRKRDGSEAIVFCGEDQVVRRTSWNELYAKVSTLAQAMRAAGVSKDDRVAAYIPNLPEAVIGMLAASSIGAIWSSCSPDFGVQGVLDRFGQIEPKLLLCANGYYYNGKTHDCLDKVRQIRAQLPSVETVVVVPYSKQDIDLAGIDGALLLADFVGDFEPGEIVFEALEFNHPLYIMYSSGTTGVPKCIVHGAGGTLLQHLKEHLLHCDVKEGERIFYFTTCGWMMWNWLVSALACRATILLYDGSPFYPDGNVLFDLADRERMNVFGTSAKFIDAVKKAGLVPRDSHNLDSVRLMTSTGSPLVPESFDFVYESIKADLQLASISGGTDIIGCFVLGNPTSAVWRGEIQARALAMDIAVFDDEGASLVDEPGELVCKNAFPSMPIHFWNDPNDVRYRAAYFERFPGVWHHGDWVKLTPRGGMIIYGRSDAVLNPGGVRIGTAEIYRQVEQLEEVVESIAVGQPFDGDMRILLFVVLRPELSLDNELTQKIRNRIRQHCSPHHVPAIVLQVSDIPRTKSGKITELAVRDVVCGRPVKNRRALANPEALDLYRDLEELQT